MKNIKRITSILIVIILALSFCGCGKSKLPAGFENEKIYNQIIELNKCLEECDKNKVDLTEAQNAEFIKLADSANGLNEKEKNTILYLVSAQMNYSYYITDRTDKNYKYYTECMDKVKEEIKLK